jgi:adenosylhomocysteine nucleosidase
MNIHGTNYIYGEIDVVAILSALFSEIQSTIKAIESPVESPFAGRVISQGMLSGSKVVVGHTGVGKALAAMTLQGVIDRHFPSIVVFLGIAGALNPEYEIGDVVIAADCVQHDFDATPFDFARGEIPYENIIELASDQRLVDYALRWKAAGRRLHVGRILSGDRFVSTAGETKDAFLRDELRGDAVDMEGAAAALVAHLNGIPFLHARIISDKADGRLPVKFKGFMKESSDLLMDFASYIAKFS